MRAPTASKARLGYVLGMAIGSVMGVILAGGRSTRMGGGDKSLRLLAGRPMLARVVDRLRPQVGSIVLNANGDPDRFAAFGLPVVTDPVEGFPGPLTGILAGLNFARRQSGSVQGIITVAADTPFFPHDLAARLAGADEGVTIARTGGRLHPVFGHFPIACAVSLDEFLKREASRKVTDWLDRIGFTPVDFALGDRPVDPFFNINTPDDFAEAEALILQSH